MDWSNFVIFAAIALFIVTPYAIGSVYVNRLWKKQIFEPSQAEHLSSRHILLVMFVWRLLGVVQLDPKGYYRFYVVKAKYLQYEKWLNAGVMLAKILVILLVVLCVIAVALALYSSRAYWLSR